MLREATAMARLLILTKAQMRRIEPYLALSHGAPRVDDRPFVIGIIYVIRNGLRWRDAPWRKARTRPCTTDLSGEAG